MVQAPEISRGSRAVTPGPVAALVAPDRNNVAEPSKLCTSPGGHDCRPGEGEGITLGSMTRARALHEYIRTAERHEEQADTKHKRIYAHAHTSLHEPSISRQTKKKEESTRHTSIPQNKTCSDRGFSGAIYIYIYIYMNSAAA